jgi:hypothetical protein
MKKIKLDDIELSVTQSKCIMDCLAVALNIGGQDRGNGMECLGCESQEGRREDSVRDVFVVGQNLYTLGADGKRYVKYFGSYVWYPMTSSVNIKITQP